MCACVVCIYVSQCLTYPATFYDPARRRAAAVRGNGELALTNGTHSMSQDEIMEKFGLVPEGGKP